MCTDVLSCFFKELIEIQHAKYAPSDTDPFFFSGFSVIQFCSTAFAYYAQATAAGEIFGHTLQSLRGIKYLYKSVTRTLVVQLC